MGKRTAFLTAVAAAVALASVPPATAGVRQLSADGRPRVSGPLTQNGKRCKEQRERVAGDVVAVGQSCLRLYTFDANAESDNARDYGVVWLQSTLDPKPGWCGLNVRSDINLPSRVEITARAPRRKIELSERTRRRIRLRPRAGGTADEDAAISQAAILYPRTITRSLEDGGRVYRLRWRGSRGRKLAFVSGLELSWEADSPPGAFSFALNYEIRRKKTC